ncbi:ABC transporter substrate-binding protein [Spirillospora sp. NPDC048911]|uniref:ABC transporter substrate-binding protein n=1 Tax=Spirillospora sp. NPDC048911 TaxID=3364527 RepID=UPI003716FFE1
MDVLPLRSGDPDRLSGYRLTGLIGEGGQGSVFLGEGDDGVKVAVKLLHARLSAHPKARSRFAAELEVAQRVAPFCTARILDADVDGDRPYIVSEYIDGPSLAQVLATEGPRAGAVLDRIAIGTITALAAIHEAGVVHRDFKPGNVLLPPDGPRVIDFGIARALDATGTMSSTTVGTPSYMAPEQISGAQVGPEADVFAWGTTMVYAATGRPPFGQDSIPAVMHRILNLPPDLGALTEPLRDLVLNCLSKDPALRPSSQQVLVRLLDLAGSLPQAGSGPQAQPAAVLTQGAAAAAEATEVRLLPSPSTPSPSTPSPSTPSPSTPSSSTPSPSPSLPSSSTPPPFAPSDTPPAAAPPALPPGFAQPNLYPPHNPYAAPGHPYAQPAPGGNGGGAPWPYDPNSPGAQITSPAGGLGMPGGPAGPSGPRGRMNIGVLAGVGGAVLVALVLAGSVIAVNVLGKEDEQQPRTGGQFNMILGKFLSGEELNPSQAGYGTSSRFAVKQLFTGLTEITDTGTVRNRLATRIAPDTTCTTWQIDVKSGTTFSNGEPVTAEAFVRGWNRAAQNRTGSAALLMTNIKGYAEAGGSSAATLSGVQAVTGQNRFDVTLTKPDCEFDQRLADPVFFPVPAGAGKTDNESYNIRPIGNGPFKIDSYARDKDLSLVRNESWGFGKANLDRVTVRFSDDYLTAGRTGFTAGDYQWAEIGTDSMASARSQSGLLTRPSMSMNYLVPITSRGPMKSKEARLAVSYAIDRRAMSNGVFGGLYKTATGLVSPAVPGFGRSGVCPSCETSDPVKAKQLADQAGLKAGTKLTIYARDLTTYRRWAEIVRQQLQQNLGWSVEVKTVKLDDKEMRRTLLGKDAPGGLLTYGWVPDYPSAYGVLQPLLSSDQVATETNGTLNYSGWRNQQFDEALANATKDPQAATRLNGLQQAEKLALDDMALIPLWSYAKAALASDKFTGLKLDHDGDPTLATAALK